jgi:hypothetical protein
MKFFEQINNTTMKVAKGVLAIFMIKLLLFSGVFIFQSCEQNELFENEEQTIAKENFKNSAFASLNSLNKIDVTTSKNNSDLIMAKTNGDFAEIKVYKKLGVTTSDTPNIELSSGLEDLFKLNNTDLGVKYVDGSESDNISDDQQLLGTLEISVQAAQSSLEPTLEEAKNYLRSNGYTNADIAELLTADEDGPAMSESDLIPAVMQLIAEEQNSGLAASFNYASLFGTSMHASQIGECAGDALGISAITAVINQGLHTAAGKKLLKKAIRKVASRALGWIGAAIFVYEFADCMGWFGDGGNNNETDTGTNTSN